MAPLQNLTTTEEHIQSNENETPMQQFYNNKSIFMTGGTGFLGKVIMDKLLRTCNIDNIYLLVRNKKGKDVHSRVEEIFDDALFDRLKRDNPKFRHKIVAINGDCNLPNLGINNNERDLLKNTINIVLHSAATVRFDEKFKLALGINVNGTKEIILLCKEMKQLKAFVHVSTAYANCNRLDIDEKFYKPKISGDNAIKLCESLDEKTLDAITPEIIKEWPNTYTFTKCLAEDLIKTMGKGLPVVVFRPAIVIPTYKEPVPGWIDNMYGPTGIVVGVGAGLLRVLHVSKELNAEIVPVDMCVNSLLASAWDVSQNVYDEIPIYNYVTSNNNPITWGKYCDLGVKHGSKMPLSSSIWYYTITMSSSKFFVTLLTLFYHIIPAIIMDTGLLLIGKKTKMLQIYKKVHKFCEVLAYFNNRRWYFNNDNVKQLWNKLTINDQQLFYFNMDNINWSEFIRDSILGIRTYLMKDDPKTIPDAHKRMIKLKILHYTIIYSIYIILLYIFYKFIQYIF